MTRVLHAAAAAAALALTLFLAGPVAAASGPVVEAPAGAVRGEVGDGVDVYRGIPYAGPPTGQNRWKPPVPAPAWRGVRDATRFGPACVQRRPVPAASTPRTWARSARTACRSTSGRRPRRGARR